MSYSPIQLRHCQTQLLSDDTEETLQALRWLAEADDAGLLLSFYLPLAIAAVLHPNENIRKIARELYLRSHGEDWTAAQADVLHIVRFLENPDAWILWEENPAQFRAHLLDGVQALLDCPTEYLPALASSAHYRALLLNLAGNLSLLLNAYAQAETLLRAILPHAAQDADLHYRLARVLHHAQRASEARAFYENALALEPENLYALESIAQLLRSDYPDERQVCILYLQRAIAIEPFSAPLYHQLADCHYAEAEYERAFQFIEIALSINEHYPEALSLLARYHLQVKGDAAAALEVYLKGLDHPLHGHNALLLEEAGDLYAHSLQDYERARLCYEKAQASAPQRADILLKYCHLLIEYFHDQHKAIDLLTKFEQQQASNAAVSALLHQLAPVSIAPIAPQMEEEEEEEDEDWEAGGADSDD